MSTWSWVGAPVVIALHDRQLAEHGGPSGVRDPRALESALARPVNLAAYEEPDAAALAASYAFGLARNHSFVDGNKRTAWVVARLFLTANGIALNFARDDAVRTMLALASGDLDEDALTSWFRERIATR